MAVLASGCAKAKAASAPEGPPLNVPTPPARVLLPVEEPLAENPPSDTDATPEEPSPPPPRNAGRPRPSPSRAQQTPTPPAEEPKPDVPAAQAPAVSEPAAPRPVTQADPVAERNVRDVLTKAANDLKRVDYQKLTADGKAQYEQSKRFAEQAEQELKNRSYSFAKTVADKAAAIATELLGAR